MRCYYWRQLKVQRHFLRGVFAVLFVLVAAVLQTDLANAGSLEGNCVPARDPASKWTCKIDDFQSKCDRQSTASLDPIWRIIDDEAEAQQLLAWQFEKFGNLRDFAQWLVCQGFSVAVSKSESRGDLKADEIGMTACYRLSQGVPVPVPWYRPLPPYGGCFDLIFDKSGGIGTIKHGYNTK